MPIGGILHFVSSLTRPFTVLLREFIVTSFSVLLIQSPKQISKLSITVFIPLPGLFSLWGKGTLAKALPTGSISWPFNVNAGCGCSLALFLLCQKVIRDSLHTYRQRNELKERNPFNSSGWQGSEWPTHSTYLCPLPDYYFFFPPWKLQEFPLRNFLLYHLAILVGQHLEKNIGTYLNLILQSYKQFLGQRLYVRMAVLGSTWSEKV